MNSQLHNPAGSTPGKETTVPTREAEGVSEPVWALCRGQESLLLPGIEPKSPVPNPKPSHYADSSAPNPQYSKVLVIIWERVHLLRPECRLEAKSNVSKGYEIVVAVITALRGVTQCNLVDRYQHFGETC